MSENIKKIKKLIGIRKRVDNANSLVDKINSVNQDIHQTLTIKGDLAVDKKTFSLMNITKPEDLV